MWGHWLVNAYIWKALSTQKFAIGHGIARCNSWTFLRALKNHPDKPQHACFCFNGWNCFDFSACNPLLLRNTLCTFVAWYHVFSRDWLLFCLFLVGLFLRKVFYEIIVHVVCLILKWSLNKEFLEMTSPRSCKKPSKMWLVGHIASQGTPPYCWLALVQILPRLGELIPASLQWKR